VSDHIELAREFIAKGEEFYAKAADEIGAWLAEDLARTQRQAAAALGRSQSWVQRLVTWRTSDSDTHQPTPFAGEYEERIERAGKQALRQAPEVIAEMVEELHDDPAFRAAVASASSRIEAKTEQRADERERVQRGVTEQEQEFERLRKDIRAGNYGEAERRLEKMDTDEEVSAYLRKQAERHRQLAEWLDAWADAKPIADAQLQEWLS
jgi:hypothetical protein